MVIDYGKLIFGGVDSSDYDIYVSGEGTYNAPERAVEFVDVPGRNGAIAIDQGRYNNITVTYPAMYLGENQEDFRDKLAAFRNAILSQKGYQRLEDSYHPEEYRMGLYSAGLEVSSVFTLMQGGEFELTFNCKPQRWLKSGEDAVTVANGRALNNHTPFDARPLLAVTGYGDIGFNGYTINLMNVTIGQVYLWNDSKIAMTIPGSSSVYFNPDLLASGDTFTVSAPETHGYIYPGPSDSFDEVQASHSLTGATSRLNLLASGRVGVYELLGNIQFTKGTASTKSDALTITLYKSTVLKATVVLTFTVAYDGDYTVTYSLSCTISGSQTLGTFEINTGGGSGTSTVSILGNPTYIDCDIGEVYMIKNGNYVSLNRYVALGADLPVLKPGKNVFEIDNTITQLKVYPRWWII